MAKWFENESMRKENGDQAKMNLVEWMKSKPPLVSIEDRTVVGTIGQGLNSTNHMLGVGGSRNW